MCVCVVYIQYVCVLEIPFSLIQCNKYCEDKESDCTEVVEFVKKRGVISCRARMRGFFCLLFGLEERNLSLKRQTGLFGTLSANCVRL